MFIKFESRNHPTVSVSFCLLFRLVIADLNESRTAKDLAEQCIKVLELICTREAGGVFEAGGLTCVLGFIRDNGGLIHKDTLHSAMAVVSRLCSKMEPNEDSLGVCSYNFFFYYIRILVILGGKFSRDDIEYYSIVMCRIVCRLLISVHKWP